MLKKVRNAWGEFFRGTCVVPFKTMLKHPVCVIIWWMISCALPMMLYLLKSWRDEREIERTIVRRHTYRTFNNELNDK